MAISSYFNKFKRGVEFMDGRKKIELSDLCTGEAMHIVDVAFLPGEMGDYAVFTTEEKPESFVFGNSVVTEILKQISDDGMVDELKNVGVVFSEKLSKKNRKYICMDFVD